MKNLNKKASAFFLTVVILIIAMSFVSAGAYAHSDSLQGNAGPIILTGNAITSLINIITGKAAISAMQTSSKCSDSDDITYNVKGTVTITRGKSAKKYYDSCTGKSGNLQERYCSSKGALRTKVYKCPNGCSNGACSSSKSAYTSISACGIAITEQGKYRLINDLTSGTGAAITGEYIAGAGMCIEIVSDNVNLNLNGYSISDNDLGIKTSSVKNIIIENGRMQNNNGGIKVSDSQNVTIRNIVFANDENDYTILLRSYGILLDSLQASTSNIKITNNSFSNSGVSGIQLRGVPTFYVSNVKISIINITDIKTIMRITINFISQDRDIINPILQINASLT